MSESEQNLQNQTEEDVDEEVSHLNDSFQNSGNNVESLNLTLIIKSRPRRKFNSHQWILNGFAKAIKAEYIMILDTSNIFDQNHFLGLFEQFNQDKKEVREENKSFFSFSDALGQIQLFDFELANACYNPRSEIGRDKANGKTRKEKGKWCERCFKKYDYRYGYYRSKNFCPECDYEDAHD